MADSEKNVSYGVSADATPFEQGMQRAADAARGAATNIDAHFKKVQDAFGGVLKQLQILAGLVAGGAFFKEAISASNQLTGETMKLTKALGITGEEADTLRTALGDIGSDSDTYIGAFQKFARQLKTNEAGLQAMGLQTRDANGNLRDSNELYTEALQLVGEYRPGLDQTTAAMTLFGKSVDEVIKLQKLDNEVKEQARKKNEELGLTITKDNVAASKAYKLAMNDVGDVLLAVKKTIGDAVMPVFTELAQYFASAGPYVIEVFKGAMMGLLTAFEVIRGAVKTLSAVVFEGFTLIVDGAGMLGEVFTKLFAGDFSGAYEAAKSLGKRTAQAFSGAFSAFVQAGNEIPDAIDAHAGRLYGSGGGRAGAPKSKGDRRMGDFKSGSEKDSSQMAAWEKELAERRYLFEKEQQAEGSVRQFSKQQEADFWRSKIEMTAAGTSQRMVIERKALELERSILKDKVDAQRAAFDTEAAAFKNNTDAKLEILNRELSFVKSRYGQESKEYEEVQKKIVETKRQAAEQQRQIDELRADAARNAQLAELQYAEQQAQLRRDLGEITAQDLLRLEQTFEDRRLEITRGALKAREQILKDDPDKNKVELERIHAEIEDLERQHAARVTQIRNQQVLESTMASRKIFASMTEGMQSALSRMIQGMSSFRGFLTQIWQSIRSAVADTLAKMVVDFLKNTAIMAAIKRALAVFDIGANAAQAGAGAAASAADVPVVGWIMAPIAAAATFAMASAFAGNVPSFSAAGGFDIPGTINPVIQAHANEMVLPAKHADVIRNLAEESGSTRSVPSVTFAMQGTPLKGNFFIVHKDDFISAAKKFQRDFAWKP